MNTSRLEAFSDGVFAVAITLLVLQFTIPEVESGKLLAKVLGQWPQLVTYVASFLTVGVVWVNHHTVFRNLRAVDRTIQFINLVLLMTVVLLPYPTALLGRYLNSGQNGSVAAAFYVSRWASSPMPHRSGSPLSTHGSSSPCTPSPRSTTRSTSSRGERSESNRGVHAAQVAAGHGAEETGPFEPRLGSHLLPSRIRKGMRHPRVAAIGPVFDDDQAATRFQHRLHRCKDRALVAEEVQRVGHDDPVEARQCERSSEISDEYVEPGRGKPHSHLRGQPAKHARVAVDCGYVRARSEKIRQRERERPFAGPKVGPRSTRVGDAITKQVDEVSLLHDRPRPARALSARRFPGNPSARLRRPPASRLSQTCRTRARARARQPLLP